MTLEDLHSCGVRLKAKAELGTILEQLYPHIDWTTLHIWTGRFAQQRHLERVVADLFRVHSNQNKSQIHPIIV
jgi:hypothetical protein